MLFIIKSNLNRIVKKFFNTTNTITSRLNFVHETILSKKTGSLTGFFTEFYCSIMCETS